MWRAEFFAILSFFLPFAPPNNRKNQNFEKMERTPRDIFILHLSATNGSHMMFASWDMERNRDNIIVITMAENNDIFLAGGDALVSLAEPMYKKYSTTCLGHPLSTHVS